VCGKPKKISRASSERTGAAEARPQVSATRTLRSPPHRFDGNLQIGSKEHRILHLDRLISMTFVLLGLSLVTLTEFIYMTYHNANTTQARGDKREGTGELSARGQVN
jgi:hypothetical protein